MRENQIDRLNRIFEIFIFGMPHMVFLFYLLMLRNFYRCDCPSPGNLTRISPHHYVDNITNCTYDQQNNSSLQLDSMFYLDCPQQYQRQLCDADRCWSPLYCAFLHYLCYAELGFGFVIYVVYNILMTSLLVGYLKKNEIPEKTIALVDRLAGSEVVSSFILDIVGNLG